MFTHKTKPPHKPKRKELKEDIILISNYVNLFRLKNHICFKKIIALMPKINQNSKNRIHNQMINSINCLSFNAE